MSLKLTWYGQAGYVLSSGDYSLAIDLYFSDSIAAQGFIRLYPSPVKKGSLKVNSVISTHNHGDHLDIETLRDYIGFENFYGPESCVENLKSNGFPGQKLHLFNRGDKQSLGPFEVCAVFAEHTPDSIGVVVESGNMKIYFTGDSRQSRQLGMEPALSNTDIIVVCINGKFGNMSWQEAVLLSHRLSVKTAIPMHYDLFAVNSENPMLFESAFINSPIQCRILNRNMPYDVAALLER